MNNEQMDQLKAVVRQAEAYPGYPTSRLSLNTAEWDTLSGTLPDGPWSMNAVDPPSAEEAATFVAAGYAVDALGRPLHPSLMAMVTDPEIGVIVGKGAYWNWGPNYTADPIVITRTASPRVLLIKRGDTGAWALPGGFVDPSDQDAAAAAVRELEEEAGLTGVAQPKEVFVGVVADTRTTAHAWAETSAYLFEVDRQVPVAGNDDAVDARWVRLDAVHDTLFGSHGFLISQALKHTTYERRRPIADILLDATTEHTIQPINAGHMAYDHAFIYTNEGPLFVKQHVPERFDDPFREMHSLEYLKKEYTVYEHVAERGFAAIPDRVELVAKTTLAMDALHEKDGWRWRAPKGPLADSYIQDILRELDQLALVPIPHNPDYHHRINPTYETFWREGWDDLTDEKIEPLIAKIQLLSSTWSEPRQEWVQRLISALPSLRTRATEVDRNPTMVMAHNDARQSNIAWHPEHGARLVDWSWADPAPKHADSTMFLVDMQKAGYDVQSYREHINTDQLITLIGFWLAHSLWQTRDGSTTVREQQVASAVTAFRVLRDLESSA